jgi:hypothetical protein
MIERGRSDDAAADDNHARCRWNAAHIRASLRLNDKIVHPAFFVFKLPNAPLLIGYSD